MRHLHLLPKLACVHSPCDASVMSVLDAPPVVRVPVEDAIGIVYDFDLQLTYGAYVLFAFAIAWSVVRPLVRDYVRRRREK